MTGRGPVRCRAKLIRTSHIALADRDLTSNAPRGRIFPPCMKLAGSVACRATLCVCHARRTTQYLPVALLEAVMKALDTSTKDGAVSREPAIDLQLLFV